MKASTVCLFLLTAALTGAEALATAPPDRACFLLHEVGKGEIRRDPADACRTRVSPQSTFKIPHALAALDAGVISNADSSFAYDGTPYPFEAWRRDHTLTTAMRFSVPVSSSCRRRKP